MARKRFSPERIITMLGEAEVLLNQSNPVAEVCRKLGGYPGRPTSAGARSTAG
jgi:hypothetical protein